MMVPSQQMEVTMPNTPDHGQQSQNPNQKPGQQSQNPNQKPGQQGQNPNQKPGQQSQNPGQGGKNK
jgi:hypothetical protein